MKVLGMTLGSEPTMILAGGVLAGEGVIVCPGGVVMDDNRIVAVGSPEDLRRQFGGIREQSYPHHVLVPGLVNAHTHLELGYLHGVISPGHFVEWVQQLMYEILARRKQLPELVAQAVAQGIEQSLGWGVTTLGDISKQVQDARPMLRQGPLRGVSFGEVQALGLRRDLLAERLAAAADRHFETPLLRCGLSPHAPYTVEGPALQQIMASAKKKQLPVCMHLAELQEEREFLASLQGRLREVWDMLPQAASLLDGNIPRCTQGPVEWAREWGLLQAGGAGVPVVLAHVNYADDAELDILAQSQASVVYCPRARHFFGHDAITPHRFRDMLERGINVCLGTDSLASNADLSVLREAQFVKKYYPETPSQLLLEMLTWRGSRALGQSSSQGFLQAEQIADMAAFALPAHAFAAREKVLDILLELAPPASAVWIDGRGVEIQPR